MSDSLTPDQLPTWMRRALRPTDWGSAISIVTGFLITLPLWFYSGISKSSDIESWIYSTANTAEAFSEGRFYPRWDAAAMGGYGAPIPHYIPPLPAYSSALVETILTDNASIAVQWVIILCLSLSGLPIYQLTARRRSAAAGLLTSTLYLCSPYILFTTPTLLGDMPGVISHLLLPLLLWSLDTALASGQRWHSLLTAFVLAALMLTDLRYAAVGSVLYGFYVLWRAFTSPRTAWRPAVFALIGGLLMSAFYWLPALLEWQIVTWQPPPPQPYLPSLDALFQPLRQIDPLDMAPPPQYTLGLPLGILAILSAPALIIRRSDFCAFFLLLGSLCAALSLLWGQAWLLGCAALCLAIGAGAALDLQFRLPAALRPGYYALLLLTAISSALPSWLSIRPDDRVTDVSAGAQIQYELQGFGIATLPSSWGIPNALKEPVSYNPALINGFITGDVSRIDFEDGTGPIQIGLLEHTGHSDRFQMQTNVPASINLLTAGFAGWDVRTTSGTAILDREEDTGLLRLSFPGAFNSDLTVYLGSTPPRLIGWAISGTALLLMMVWTLRHTTSATEQILEYRLLRRAEIAVTIIVLMLSVIIATASITGLAGPLQAQAGSGLAGSTIMTARTETGLEAMGYRQGRAGDNLVLDVYWRTLRVLEANLKMQLSFINAATGAVEFQVPLQHPGGVPTRRWVPGYYVSDHYQVAWTDVSGLYFLRLEVYQCQETCLPENRLTFFDGNGLRIGPSLDIPMLR